MAPSRIKKAKLSIDSDASTRQKTVKTKSPAVTPQQSPRKRVMGITEAQKQALVDNLQLEVTERARKLRAQYVLQAQGLRTRIELRINRIPTALRKANMGELLAKYTELQADKPKTAAKKAEAGIIESATNAPKRIPLEESQPLRPAIAPKSRGTKRTSDVMESADKENDDAPVQAIPNPKKRIRGTKAGNDRQHPNPSTVLSPKSANSRTLPQSPVRTALCSPQKSYISRPASPLKPISPIKAIAPTKVAAAAAATASLANAVKERAKPGRPKATVGSKPTYPANTVRSGGRGTRRAVEPAQESESMRKVSNSSNASNLSTGTTIVKNLKKAPTAASRRGNTAAKAAGRRVNAGTEAPPTGRRVLRKRT